MARTGATLIGSYETVRVMEAAGVPRRPDDLRRRRRAGAPVRRRDRVGAARASTAACGRTRRWRRAARCASATSGSRGRSSRSGCGACGRHLATALAPGRGASTCVASSVGQSARGDGGALVYLFETPEGSLLFQDTSGHWSGILDGARAPTWRSSPRPAAATSTASRSRARWPSSSPGRWRPCGRGGWCSATTTTGCPGSPCRPRWRRCAPRSPRRHRAPSCSSPATSPPPTCSPTCPPETPEITSSATAPAR